MANGEKTSKAIVLANYVLDLISKLSRVYFSRKR